jgi:hypothetical protein
MRKGGKTVKIEVWLNDCSEPRIYEKVVNLFQEGQLLCVDLEDKILKYPMSNIFRVVQFK